MRGGKEYFQLKDLEAYQLAREYGRLCWVIFEKMGWHTKKILGDQMIRSVDSVGAHIAEGYGRFHYKDKNKFYYNARGSLLEAKHWMGVFEERRVIHEDLFLRIIDIADSIQPKLNGLILSQYNRSQ